jgi:glycosyltransferase involved in cell wall biosynthesis
MTELPLDVTVVIPCYNRWPHIQKAITSVLEQSHRQTHCLVVDDASTDGSFTALERHYGHHPRVTLLRLPENRGQSAARNFGAQHVETELICFLDSDDLLFRDAVASRVGVYHEAPEFRGIAFGQKLIEDHERGFPDDNWQRHGRLTLNDYLRCKDLLHTNTFMIPTRLFLKSGGFDEALRNQEDIELFLRLLAQYEARYSGEKCCRIEAVDNQRARHDLKRIIEQGNRFSSALLSNPTVMEQADSRLIKALLEHDLRVTLSALYKSGQFDQYRRLLQKARKDGLIKMDGRLIKRYWLSLFR